MTTSLEGKSAVHSVFQEQQGMQFAKSRGNIESMMGDKGKDA